MHYEDGQLLSYSDGEVSSSERTEIAAHLEGCAECRARLDGLESDRALAARALGMLRPNAEVLPLPARDPARAAAPAPASAPARPARRIRWGSVAAAAAAVLVIASLAFPPVRSAAAGLLKVFRVQQVRTIELTPADLQSISDALNAGQSHIDLKSMGEVWIEGAGSEPKRVSLAEAQAAVDFPVKLPASLKSAPKITLQQTQTYRFKLNVDAINQALRYYGSDRSLPSGVDGKVFSVTIPAILLAEYPASTTAAQAPGAFTDSDAHTGIFVGQARSPELVVPEGVDVAEMRTVLLSLPFIPQTVRDQLAAVSDWQSTLIIPNVGGSARDISLDGVPAVVMSGTHPLADETASADSLGASVIWNDAGVVRGVGGAINEETAIEVAKSTMR